MDDKNKNKNKNTADILGVDLGTTYSVIGLWKNGKVEIFTNDAGNRTTPSVVGFTNQEVVAGETAKNQLVFNPKNTIFESKRMLGKMMNDPKLQADRKNWPFETKEGPDGGVRIEVTFKGEKKVFLPQEISGMVLKHLKSLARKRLGYTLNEMVVTVPAYFNDAQRVATKEAGKLGDVDIQRIVNEPTAACMAYGMHRRAPKDPDQPRAKSRRTVLIFDLGGGTYDVSLLLIENGVFEVKGTNGDTHLGGEDFDRKLVDYVLQQFDKDHPETPGIKEDFRARRRLQNAMERIKRTLSFKTEATLEIDALYEGVDYTVELSRAKFEKLCEPIFKRLMLPLDALMLDTRCRKKEVQDIVMVGGSTRIPAIQDMIEEYFGTRHVSRSINPDEAVAYGAAVQGAVLCAIEGNTLDDLLLLDVVAISLGVETEGKFNQIMIPKNHGIPCCRMEHFQCQRDYQTELLVKVIEGERPLVADCHVLAEFKIKTDPCKQSKSKIRVDFDVDADGVLVVKARDCNKPQYRGWCEIASDKRTLSKSEIDRILTDAKQYESVDKKTTELTRAQIDLGLTLNDVQTWLADSDNFSKIKPDDRAEEFRSWLEYFTVWAEGENETDIDHVKSKHQLLKEKWNELIEKPDDPSYTPGYYDIKNIFKSESGKKPETLQ